jgi:hypothetical protein
MRTLLRLVVVPFVLLTMAPARADIVRYERIAGVSADGRLGSGGKYAEVWAFRWEFHHGSLPSDPENGFGRSEFGCVVFVSGSVRKETCGSLRLVADDTTLSTAAVTGTLPQPGGGTLTVNVTVTADAGPPFALLPVDPLNPGVPTFCVPLAQPPPCQLIGGGVGRPGATSGSVRSSTLGTVNAAAVGGIARSEYLLLDEDL